MVSFSLISGCGKANCYFAFSWPVVLRFAECAPRCSTVVLDISEYLFKYKPTGPHEVDFVIGNRWD